MSCGIWNPYQRILDVSTISRKLNDGDKLVLTITNLATNPNYAVEIAGVITYSINITE